MLHDLVTARVSPEYFHVALEQATTSAPPDLLAVKWGIISTWWIGLALGLLLAFAARRGSRPPRSVLTLLAPIARLLVAMAVVATIAGTAGWIAASAGIVVLVEPLASRVPADRHVAFIAVLWTHIASYAAGAIGGVWTCSRVWKSRTVS